MKLIHTSDWHIGRTLYGRKRYEESEAFFTWLAELIKTENVDALLVAGDIFDNSAPSNSSQELYYRFLYQVAGSGCRHVVITAGNHDSPSFLNAPREVLRYLNVHVIGCATPSICDEVLVLSDINDEPELIVCAVPYLRDRDLRQVEAGESLADKERKLVEGIRAHYDQVCDEAQKIRSQLNKPVPIVAMGHLFTTGGQTVDGDGVRDLYVGTLAHVGSDMFPPDIDYWALGHLHLPQKVKGSDTMRYSGSPLPMGFGEAIQEKNVCQVVFSGIRPVVTSIPVPRFQSLKRIRGDWTTISEGLNELKSTGSKAWLEIIYEGNEIIGDLRLRLDEALADSELEIIKVTNNRILEQALSSVDFEETLNELDPNEVFIRCLEAHDVPESQQAELLQAYNETVASLENEEEGK